MTLVSIGSPVRTATTVEEPHAVDILVRAFRTDPCARWVWPDPEQYRAAFPEFVRAFAGRAFEHESAFCVEGFLAAALWLPPGVEPDEDALAAVLERTIPEHDQAAAFALFDQMGRFHPGEPHWYLPLIGVDPIHQRKGYGSALMKYALARCDRERLPAYLESSNPENVSLYERHGFEVLGTIQVGSSPPVLPMLRAPR
jgi:ribosomal protein S18 acetylase RimI-like enzyme